MSIGTCSTCLYYIDYKKECRLNPPQTALQPVHLPTNPSGVSTVSFWPQVDADDYCSGWTDARVNGRKVTFPEYVRKSFTEQQKG